MDWDEHFFEILEVIRKRSKDPSRKFAALIIDHRNSMVSTGYNGPPRGAPDARIVNYPRPIKYYYYVHAEVNAICNAARRGVALDGTTMYVLEVPCATCVGMIIQAGVREVVCAGRFSPPRIDSPEWNKSQPHALNMLQDCGISVRFPREDLLDG